MPTVCLAAILPAGVVTSRTYLTVQSSLAALAAGYVVVLAWIAVMHRSTPDAADK